MCAQFMLRASVQEISRSLQITEASLRKNEGPLSQSLKKRVLPHSLGWVARCSDQKRVLSSMTFSLLPHWSKLKQVRFATHNARLESTHEKDQKHSWIFEKPTWKEAFLKRHCVVPMTHFFEPIYTGKWAGHMVQFKSKDHHMILWAAGVWEEWIGPDGEVVDSFAIITDQPHEFVKRSGHDRSPLFLTEKGVNEWLREGESQNPMELVHLLRNHVYSAPLTLEIDRPLKPGWEKKIKPLE